MAEQRRRLLRVSPRRLSGPGISTLGAIICGIIILASAAALSQNADRPGRNGIRALEQRVNAELRRDQPSVEPLTGPIRVKARDISWVAPGTPPILLVDSLVGIIDAGRLLAGGVVITRLAIFEPTLRLVRAPGAAEWNYQTAIDRLLGPGQPSPAPPPQARSRRLVLIEDITITGGVVLVRPPSGEAIEVRDLAASIPRFAIAGPSVPEPEAEITRLSATLALDEQLPALPLIVSDAELRFPAGELEFTVARLELASSLFTAARGQLDFGVPGLGLDATAHAERVMLADLRSLLPRAPTEGTATFDLAITTNAAGRSALEVSALDLAAEGSRIRGSFGFAFGGAAAPAPLAVDLTLEPLTIALIERFTGPLPYDGSIRGRIRGPPSRIAFDLAAQLTTPDLPQPFTAGLVGVASFVGEGLRLAHLDIDLRRVPLVAFRPFVPGLSLEGVVSGHLVLEGVPGEVPMRVDLRLEVAAGVITLAGVIDLSGPSPTYDLSGRLVDIRLEDLLEPSVPPVLLTARFTLVGSGLRPAVASARLRLSGIFSGWQTGPADSVRIVAAVDNGTLTLDELQLRLATIDLSAAGTWRFEPPVSGNIRYRLAASTLAPFAPYLANAGAEGFTSGSLLAIGTLSGPLAHPRVTGTLEGSELAYGSWRADTLAATYDVVLRRPISEAEVHLTAEGLGTPIGPYSAAVLDLAVADSLITVDLNAEGTEGNGPLILVASGSIEPGGRRDLQVTRFRFDLDGEAWTLVQPARIAWGPGPGVIVENLLLRETIGPGMVAINGSYPPTDTAALRIEVIDLPVAEVLAIAGYPPVVMGLLSLDLSVHGPPGDASVGGTFTLANGSYRGQAITLIQGTLLAEDRRLDAMVTAQLDTAGTVRLDASVPLILDLTGIPDLTLPRDEPLRVAATADSLALRILALSVPELRDVTGTLQAQVEITGTPASPILSGEAHLQNGAAMIVPLDQRYDQISGDLILEGQTLTVRNLVAQSDGWATITGTVTFGELSNPRLDLSAVFDGFRAVGVDDLEPAAVDGELLVGGTLLAPVIAGAVTVDDGNFSIMPFQSKTTALSAELTATLPTATPADTTTAESPEGGSWFDRVRLDDVVVTAGPNLWVVAEEFRAQLAGELILHKEVDGLQIFGTLEGDRGTFTLRVGPLVRRFTLVQTNVRFFGTTDIDPAINVTASRLVPGADGRISEVLIHLTGTLDQPSVSVTTGTGAEVPESELLSFLLFGKPSFAAPGTLPRGGGPILEEAVFGIGSLAELASIGLEEALSAELGLPLDYFLIQPTQGPFGGLGAATIIIGQEIAPNVFLTVNTGFGGLFGAATTANAWSVSLQWRITREWTLELAVEPVNPARFFRGLGTALPIVGFERQLIVELQRRWTY